MIFHLVSQVRWKSSERTQEKKEEICVRSRNPVFYGKEHENGAWFSVSWHFQRLEVNIRRKPFQKERFPLFVVYSRLSVAQKHFVRAQPTPFLLWASGKRFSRNIGAGVHEKGTRFSLTESRRFSSDFRLLDEPVCCSGNQLFYWTGAAASFVCSSKSPGWHSKSVQIVSSVFHDTNSPCRNCWR